MSSEEPVSGHLQSWEVAAFLDRSLSAAEQSRIEAHLADCEECRTEVVEVADLVRTQPLRRRWYLSVGLAAAAVLLVVTATIPLWRQGEESREPVITLAPAPHLLAPVDRVALVDTLRWTSVARADRYRVRLFDANGALLFEQSTTDTLLALPASTTLQPGATYYWMVEARAGWDRWSASPLTAFVPEHQP